MQNNDSVYIFGYDEFRILLYTLGYTECEGVFMPWENMSSERVIEGIHHLVRDGFLIAEEDGFRAEKNLEEILRIIGDHQGGFILKAPEEGREYYCYVGNGSIVVSEKLWEKKDTLRVRKMDQAEFAVWRDEIEQTDSERGSAFNW